MKMQYAAILWIIAVIAYMVIMSNGEKRRNGKTRRYYTIIRMGITAIIGIILFVGTLFIMYLR
ncbi:MAG: hypothetical protein HPY66_0844 [Firmicutes bacterium]|nr:hypothetical protein [Bacillota bacterium]MDI6706514.1 hypothetical protein [Bacillota bacterium]